MNIKPGTYTISQIFDIADFNLEKEAAVDYGDGIDRRRVKVGGLSFDDVNDIIHVPVTANELEITLDGKSAVKLSIELNEEHKSQRASSFETAADANDV